VKNSLRLLRVQVHDEFLINVCRPRPSHTIRRNKRQTNVNDHFPKINYTSVVLHFPFALYEAGFFVIMDGSNNNLWAQDAINEPWNVFRDENIGAEEAATSGKNRRDAGKTCTATWHILFDGLVGVLLSIYAILLHDVSKSMLLWAVLVSLAMVRIVRCAMILTALYAQVHAFGFLTASAWTSACMSVLHFIPSMVLEQGRCTFMSIIRM
jgi:hypothetical protein